MSSITNSSILNKYFPEISSFRDRQEEVINNLVNGQSTLCLMPTGAGKSLVYQVAGLHIAKTTVVISPLVALMEQQNKRLQEKNIDSHLFYSGIDTTKQYSTLRNFFVNSAPQFIFLSPERLAFDGYLEYFLLHNKNKIGLVVIDEAHCVSQWGHSFRPLYKGIPQVLDRVFGIKSWTTVLCLTATLNPQEQQEICRDFKIDHANVVQSSFLLRKNLKLHFETLKNEQCKKKRLEHILFSYSTDKIIVYVHRKKGEYGTKSLSEEFRAKGFSCDYFDADRTDAQKREVLNKFEKGIIKVVFATNAFGMGIDIPDIKGVIHYLLPESIEQYYQEVGRAGRDSHHIAEAFGYLLYSPTNIEVREGMIRASIPNKLDDIKLFIAKIFDDKFALDDEQRIGSFNPYLDSSDHFFELAVLYYLQKMGIVNIFARGMRSIKCLELKEVNNHEFLKYRETTNTGLIITISKKLGIAVEEIIQNLYKWYTDHQIELNSSPMKAVFYTAKRGITDNVINEIALELEEKKQARMKNFNGLIQLIKSTTELGEKAEVGICKHLGIEISDRGD